MSLTLGALGLFKSKVIGTGLVLGAMSALGFTLTYMRLPNKAKDCIKRHPLLTDVVATGATYKLLGGTLTALVASGFMSTGISCALAIPAINRWRARRLLRMGAR